MNMLRRGALIALSAWTVLLLLSKGFQRLVAPLLVTAVLIAAVSLIIYALTFALIRRTQWGRQARAVATDADVVGVLVELQTRHTADGQRAEIVHRLLFFIAEF